MACYFVDSTVNGTTTIYYDDTATTSTSYFRDPGDENTQIYMSLRNIDSLDSETLIVDFTDYPYDSDHYYNLYCSFSGTPPNLKTVKIFPMTKMSRIYPTINNMNSNTHFYCGCFGESGCDGEIGGYEIYFYSTSFTLLNDNPASMYSYFHYSVDHSTSSNGYPYVYIGGKTTITMSPYYEVSGTYFNFAYFSSLSGSCYLMTGINLSLNKMTFKYVATSTYYSDGEFLCRGVCLRKETNRYVMFNQGHTAYTNFDSLFNYPDCNYNSSMFDLILPSSSSTYSLSDDLLEWYSILFTTSNISFNGNVYVKELTITTYGTSFNVLDFGTISLENSFKCSQVLFSYSSTSTTISSDDLTVKLVDNIYKVYASTCEPGTPSLCEDDGNGGYIDTEYVTNETCSIQKLNETNELINDCDIYSSFIPLIIPYSTVYLLNENITSIDVEIDTGYVPIIITSNVNSIIINKITIGGTFDYSTYALFEIEESSELLEIPTTPTTSYSNPFVLMNQQSRKIDYVGDIQCDNQAIIINPTDTICNVLNLYDHYCYSPLSNNGDYYQNDYATIDYSCPCNKSNSNCIIELDKNEVMTYEVDLPLTTLIVYQDVTINLNNYDFNIQTTNDIDVTINLINNNVIHINDESSSFTLNLPLVGNLLLIGSLHKFSQSIAKSVTTIQSLHVSTNYYLDMDVKSYEYSSESWSRVIFKSMNV
ncbi:hypothetical protein QTN25_010183 [Entamoeba marina]